MSRLFVFGHIMTVLIIGSENELALPNCNTFYRMLAHRLADYYLLGHTVDDTMTGVTIRKTSNCRM